MINGSDEGRHIDTLRTTIKNFASTVSLDDTNTHKVVIIDEADYMNADSVQPALRNFIETFYKNCRFIFTCNFKNKIIPALHSRCTCIDFRITNGQKVKTATAFMLRLIKLLDDEQIGYDKKVIAEKEKFVDSLNDVLNNDQIVLYNVFGREMLGEAKERMRDQRKRGKNMGGFKGKRKRW